MHKHLSLLLFIALIVFLPVISNAQTKPLAGLKISDNKRYFASSDGKPFFWLGDTGWLLFSKLNREEADRYLENRKEKGFNVIQVMVLHTLGAVNAYGDSALINKNVATPKTTSGNLSSDADQYDFWDHVDYIVNKAEEKGIYMALVPVWGTNVGKGWVNVKQAEAYSAWLANRYKNKSNIIWLNGGDIKGSDSINVWKTIGKTLRKTDPNHLITYHPRGRATSSTWFHNEDWLDFNMFQSGHKSYTQDTVPGDPHYGEDNWKFVVEDYKKAPPKPTIDGEPSYEKIPHGLHDTLGPRWTDSDVRRYGYWSVFAGGCGYTYGHSAVMTMFKPTEKRNGYGDKQYWYQGMNDPGASQMKYLKELMLSKPYFERIPDQSLIAGQQGEKYEYLIATRGKNYAFVYTYTGRDIPVNMGKISGSKVKASWFNPRDGKRTAIGTFNNTGVQSFNPPRQRENGNDWILILESL